MFYIQKHRALTSDAGTQKEGVVRTAVTASLVVNTEVLEIKHRNKNQMINTPSSIKTASAIWCKEL